MSKRLFISKNASEIDPFRPQFDELGFTVVSHSFLAFSPVVFEVQLKYDVVFFSSVRSVIFFKATQSIPMNTLIACIGGKTAELLETLGHTVAFVGTQSGEPKVVFEEFKAWLGKKSVLFPISNRSLKSISSGIPEEQKEELVVYSTDIVGKVVAECDVYVFTSPSNVDGYFAANTLPQYSRIIAWGKSTETALISRAVSVEYCLEKASFEELLYYLKSI